ncbi:unnamed protein product [Phytomonas sp. EM1]|nr:unnamed protein product [Phytomonas sp. EM1]|eukprot:CCW60312.1 unnamed protein product [Phytomonas sp. isolate EM1]
MNEHALSFLFSSLGEIKLDFFSSCFQQGTDRLVSRYPLYYLCVFRFFDLTDYIVIPLDCSYAQVHYFVLPF